MIDIGGFIKVDTVNFPGKLACTVFTRGCNFRCPYCHNPSFVNDFKEETYTEDEVFEYIKKRKMDALVVSGGEPCIQKDLKTFLQKAKELGVEIKLDTNGSYPDLLKDLVDSKLVDYVAMDIKTSPEKYNLIGFKNVDLISKSIEIVKSMNSYEFRTTCAKPIVEVEDFVEIGKWISGVKKYNLQVFNNAITLDKEYRTHESFTKEEFVKSLDILKENLENIKVLGGDFGF